MTRLLITEVFPPQTGGSGRWFWEIYCRQPRENTVIAAGEHSQQTEFDQSHGLRIQRMPLALSTWGMISPTGVREYWRAFRRLAKLVATERVSEIHCGKALPEGWLGWLLKKRYGLPYLCYVHGEELNVSAQSRELTWLTRRVLRGARQLVVNSHNTARLVGQTAPEAKDKIRVLHPGVDIERFAPAPADPAARAELGWGSRPVVLTVGRLQARKGQDQLIRALPRIQQAVPDVLYVIVGDGERREALETLVDELNLRDAVQFRGDRGEAELIRCYQQCDLFVLPNREVDGDTEGFGMVLLEAQACGKPVIAGDSGGTAETMHIPETGRIVSCDDPALLAEVILELLTDADLRAAMGAAGRLRMEQHFSWEVLTRQAEEIFGGKERILSTPLAAPAEARR